MAKPKAVVEDEKPFWEKEEYVRYLMKANSPGPRLFRAKQMIINKSEKEEWEEEQEKQKEEEKKQQEKSPLQQLREIQDNIEFQFKMYGNELKLYDKGDTPTKQDDDEFGLSAETSGFLNQELLAYELYLDGRREEGVHRLEFMNLLSSAAVDVSNKIESLKVASNWLEGLGIDVASEECRAPFSNKANRGMETRQEDDEALDTEVKDALTGLEGLAIRVSGIGSYILETYFGWPGKPQGSKIPATLLEKYEKLGVKPTSTIPAFRAASKSFESVLTVAEPRRHGSTISKESSKASKDPLPEDFIIEDLKTFNDAVSLLDDLYDKALTEGRGKLVTILMNRTKTQLLFFMQSCEKKIEGMAAAVRNIIYHRETIERIRRDIAIIHEQYLPAQLPVVVKKQTEINLHIKRAQALDEKIEMLASKMESFDRQYKMLFEEFAKNIASSLLGENTIKDAKEGIEATREDFDTHGRLLKPASQQSFFKDLLPRRPAGRGRRTAKK